MAKATHLLPYFLVQVTPGMEPCDSTDTLGDPLVILHLRMVDGQLVVIDELLVDAPGRDGSKFVGKCGLLR